MRNGFSLIESMLSLSLTLAVVLAGMEFFGVSRDFLIRLKERSEDRRAALAALDRIEDDVRLAGRDLAVPMGRGLIEGMIAGNNRLILDRAECELVPAADIQPGQSRVTLAAAADVRAGSRICLCGDDYAQVLQVVGVEDNDLLISPEADATYIKERSRLLLLSRVEYYLDGPAGIVRRKEGGGGGQPLLEAVSRLEFAFDGARNLLTVKLEQRSRPGRVHESTMFPKNLAQSFKQ